MIILQKKIHDLDFYNNKCFSKNKILMFDNVTFTGIYKLDKTKNVLLKNINERDECGIVIMMETNYYSTLTSSEFGKFKGKY